MKEKKELEIIFDNGDPLIVWKSDYEKLIEEMKKELYSYKRTKHVLFITEGFVYGILFTFLIFIITFFLWVI